MKYNVIGYNYYKYQNLLHICVSDQTYTGKKPALFTIQQSLPETPVLIHSHPIEDHFQNNFCLI